MKHGSCRPAPPQEVKRAEEVVEKEVDGATFHPEVSQFANALWANANVAPAWQRLSNSYKPKTKERLEMLKKEKEVRAAATTASILQCCLYHNCLRWCFSMGVLLASS